MGWGWGLKDRSLGFYGNLHGGSLWAGVWLGALDRLAWYYSTVINLRLNILLADDALGIFSLKDVYFLQASHTVGQQSLEFVVPIMFDDIR